MYLEKMYTIKSESEDGTYFLVKDWRGNKTFWKKFVTPYSLYQSPATAISSFKKLLRTMPEYSEGKNSLVEVNTRTGIITTCYDL